jgi:copper oxidase (laccase) domain-containing protein
MLKNLGIPEDHIYPSKLDTKTETEVCFSYRNDKKTGEHFTFGVLK